jgi:LacI family transcriptional regulator
MLGTRAKILLLFDNIGKEYVSRIQSSVNRAAGAHGVQGVSENIYGTTRAVNDCLDDSGGAGVILTPPLSDDRHVLGLVEARRLPLVRIAPLLDPNRGSSVSMDEYDAARAITEHLLEAGHRRIGFIRGPRTHLVSMRRNNGFAAALGGKGLRIDPSLVVQGDFSRESGRTEGARLLSARPTAIFASNDEMAIGVIEAAMEAGIRVPEELSVVGFDDNAVAKTIRPRLTTVRQPLEEMGEAACRILVERISNPARAAAHETVPYQVMVRESVMPTAAGTIAA